MACHHHVQDASKWVAIPQKYLKFAWNSYAAFKMSLPGYLGKTIACFLLCPYRLEMLYPKTCHSLGMSDSFLENIYAHMLSCFTFFLDNVLDETMNVVVETCPFLHATNSRSWRNRGGLCKELLDQIFFLSLSRRAGRIRHDE